MCRNGISQNGTPTISEKSGDATLTTRSRRPLSWRIRSKTASTLASSVWSHASAIAFPPACLDLGHGPVQAARSLPERRRACAR